MYKLPSIFFNKSIKQTHEVVCHENKLMSNLTQRVHMRVLSFAIGVPLHGL